MDHVSFHKQENMIQVIRGHKNTVECVPVYRPNLNPIEKKWVQGKVIRR